MFQQYPGSSPTTPEGRRAVTERVRAEMRRSGGFAGRTVQARLDSEQMPPAEAARLTELISAIDFDRLSPSGPALPAGADLMRYDLMLERGGNRWQGTFQDPSIPDELRPLLQFLTAAAHPA
jgi:hypothetical protein